MLRTSRLLSLVVLLGGAMLTWLAGAAIGANDPAPIRDPEHRVQPRVASWKSLKQRNVVMQKRDYSCGAAALATLIRYYWDDAVTEEEILTAILDTLTIEENLDRVKNGLAISDLRRAAVKMGYQSSIGTLTLDGLANVKVPLVVPLRLKSYDHFVVYRGIVDGRVYLADPIRGNVRLSVAEFQNQWQKNAVLAVAKPNTGLPESSALDIRCDEIFLGEMNDQMLRTQLPGRLLKPAP